MRLINNKKPFKAHIIDVFNNSVKGGHLVHPNGFSISLTPGTLYRTLKPVLTNETQNMGWQSGVRFVKEDIGPEVIIPADATIKKPDTIAGITDRFILPFPWYIILGRLILLYKNPTYNNEKYI